MRSLHIAIDRIPVYFIQRFCLFLTVATLFISCQGKDGPQQQNLYGKWVIANAERNGKETSYLRKGYFIIDKDGMMTVNITGTDEKGKYKMKDNKIVMGDKNFELKMVGSDSMVVTYMTSPKIKFIFYMQKKHEDIH